MGSNVYDALLVFSDGQTVTGDAASTNAINLGAAEAVPDRAEVWVMFSGLATGESLQISVQESSDDGASDAYADVLSLPAISTDPTEPVRIPLNNWVVNEKYVRLHYGVTGGDSNTSITVDAYLTDRGA